MAGFFSRLETRARQSDSLLCVGLDPHTADLSAPTAAAARDFCLRLIEATADHAAAYKPNAAFFEALGPDGWAVLLEVIDAAPEGVPMILDAKRGDIASTAEAYAQSAFTGLGADAITLSPYLGRDSLTPFLADPGRGVFLLCKTSNPGTADLQDLALAGSPGQTLWEHVADLARGWNENDNLGLVVGATHPDALRRVRQIAPELWILAPGVGAQGGELAAALRAGLRADGLGLLVPVSRAISRAADPRQAAVELVEKMRAVRNAMNIERGQVRTSADSFPYPRSSAFIRVPFSEQAALADALLAAGCVRFGQFTLKSGLQSPIYLDLRQLISMPALLAQVADAYVTLLRDLNFDRLAALPYAALPIGTAISLRGDWPMIYPRKEVKGYGTGAAIEGAYAAGEQIVVIDDLATTGGSKFEAIDKLKAAGLNVRDVIVLIDRQSGAREALAEAGYALHAVLTLSQML
ncbi:MAG: orotidine-5'-phosphate decarboxylase, partial [Anaerolineae bacterium]|nr:orotidine-5'-phosphate decarboxylase [Anaerolineae bacterium]